MTRVPLRTYPGRLLAATALSSLFVLALSGLVAAALYREQARTAASLSEDIGSRGAAINLEATVHELIALHGRGGGAVEPLHAQAEADLAEIELYADKPAERTLTQDARDSFARYLALWREHAAPPELAKLLRGDALAAVQALRRYNGDELRASEGEHLRAVRRMAWGLAAVGGLGSLAGLVFGFGLARSLRRAVQQFLIRVEGAAEMLGQRVPTIAVEPTGPARDAPDDLIRRVEQAVSRLTEQEREVRRAERLAAVGQLAAGVAHEIRNPLTSAILLLQTGRRDPTAGGVTDEDLGLIESELHRIEESLKTFLDFARPPKSERARCDLAAVVRDALAVARGRTTLGEVEVTLTAPETPCEAVADRGQIGQIVLNLVLNAVDAMPAGGRLAVTLSAANGWAELDVTDSGPGIAPDILPRLFEPFATGKETGTGLGLVICKRIAEEHGGTLRGENRPEGGARFRVRLPLGVVGSL